MAGFSRINRQFGLSAKIMLVTLILSILPLILIWYQMYIQLEKMQVFLVKDAHDFAMEFEKMEEYPVDVRAQKYAESMEREYEYSATKLITTMLTLVVGVSFLLLIVARYFAHKLLMPLEILEKNVKDWDGVTPIEVFVEGEDEVANLGRQFSIMTEKMARLRAEAGERQVALETADNELMKFTISLEDQVEQKTRRFRNALEKLRTLDKAKDEFLTLITHELKTPLTSINACAEALSGKVKLPKETQKQFLDIIQTESNRLTRLINEVLDYSRISAGLLPIMFRPSNLIRLIERAILAHMPAFEKAGIKLVFIQNEAADERFREIFLDPDRIMQVLTNLLNNALKFTPKGGKTTVSVGILRKSIQGRGTDFAQVRISDTGIGIAPKERVKVFERFAQAGNMEHHTEGYGLGMPIARGLVRGHGGKIWFTSKPGKGTDFYFTLPFFQQLKINDQKDLPENRY